MPLYIGRNPYCGAYPKSQFDAQERGYHLCKKVAVATDGTIYRATDGEISETLAKCNGAPATDAPTYVKIAEELRRRQKVEDDGGH